METTTRRSSGLWRLMARKPVAPSPSSPAIGSSSDAAAMASGCMVMCWNRPANWSSGGAALRTDISDGGCGWLRAGDGVLYGRRANGPADTRHGIMRPHYKGLLRANDRLP